MLGKSILLLFAVITPILAFGDDNYHNITENIINNILLESRPVLQARMQREFPDEYKKLDSKASDVEILIKYQNLLVRKEFESIKQDLKTKFEEQSKKTGRQLIKLSKGQENYWALDGSKEPCYNDGDSSEKRAERNAGVVYLCLLDEKEPWQPYRMHWTDNKEFSSLFVQMADKINNEHTMFDYSLHTQQLKGFNSMFLDIGAETTTYECFFEDRQNIHISTLQKSGLMQKDRKPSYSACKQAKGHEVTTGTVDMRHINETFNNYN